jgi:hypothetical protein
MADQTPRPVLSARRSQPLHVAYFISPHGFGHAARAAAVMDAVHAMAPAADFEIFTSVPRWFFDNLPADRYDYHYLVTDVGFVQTTPFHADLARTLRALDGFLPFDATRIDRIGRKLSQLGCRAAICDIAPFGIAAAKKTGIPAVVIENFTWDWMYEACAPDLPDFKRHVDYLRRIFGMADLHIQTEPICDRVSGAPALPPISRRMKADRARIRERLAVPESGSLVLITTGGISEEYRFLDQLRRVPEVCFVVPGIGQSPQRRDNVLTLPHRSLFFHPDLVGASDAVIGKLGYSTLAEVYQAGVPFGYIARPNFPESSALVQFVEKNMNAVAIDEMSFQQGHWLPRLSELLKIPRLERQGANGAEQAARMILDLVRGTGSKRNDDQ